MLLQTGKIGAFPVDVDASESKSLSHCLLEFYVHRSPLENDLCRLLLSASASSAMAERTFSIMNLLHTDLRTRMSAPTLERMVVIRACLAKCVREGTVNKFLEFVKNVCDDFDARAAAVEHSRRVLEYGVRE